MQTKKLLSDLCSYKLQIEEFKTTLDIVHPPNKETKLSFIDLNQTPLRCNHK